MAKIKNGFPKIKLTERTVLGVLLVILTVSAVLLFLKQNTGSVDIAEPAVITESEK